MDASAWAALGITIPIIVALVGAYMKARSDGQGWKVSYEREKERADRLQTVNERTELATEIATRTAEAIHTLISRSPGGTS